MAMTNYPYETHFLKHLPGWPANTSCLQMDNVTEKSADHDLFYAVREAAEVFFNFDKTEKCNNIFDSGSDEDMSGWNVLACGDMAMPMY